MTDGTKITLVALGGLLLLPKLFAKNRQVVGYDNAGRPVYGNPATSPYYRNAQGGAISGGGGSNPLGSILGALLGRNNNQPQQQRSSGGASGGGSNSGGGSAPSRGAGNPDANPFANGIPPYLDQLLNSDGSLNMRQPDYNSYFNNTGVYSGNVNPSDLTPPTISFADPNAPLPDVFGGWSPVVPIAPPPDLSGVDSYFDPNTFNPNAWLPNGDFDFGGYLYPDYSSYGGGGYSGGGGGSVADTFGNAPDDMAFLTD